MRTTVNIDDAVLAWAKQRAHEDHQTLGSVIEAALQAWLARSPVRSGKPLPVSNRGGGPRPGIDLTSNRSMFEALDAAPMIEHTA